MGDPETEVVMPRIENDLVELMMAVALNKIEDFTLIENQKAACTVVLAAKGYPTDAEIGEEIIIQKAEADEIIFHAGTKINAQNKMVTAGGRVLMITALEKDLNLARNKAITLANKGFFKHQLFRKDIGQDVCE